MEPLGVMKSLQRKWKQGCKIPSTQEFFTLTELCSSDIRSQRLAACKCIFYLWDWKIIDNKTILSVMTSIAGKTSEVDGVLSIFFGVVSHLCEEGDDTFLKNELPLFHKSLNNILMTHEPAVLVALSLFDQMDFEFVYKYYRPIIHDILFGDFNNRTLIWSLISKQFNIDLHRNLLLWLKFYNLEDCFILLGSLKVMDISDTEKCLYLTVLIHNMLASGHNPEEAVRMLKDHVLNCSVHTQSLILLTLLVGIEALPEQYLFAAFSLYEWFLCNTVLWTEILSVMLVFLIPFTQMSVFYPEYQEKALKLINIIKEHIETGNSVDLKLTEMKSVVYKYLIYRHDILHQSMLVIRLLSKFKNDDVGLMEWLSKLLTFSNDPKFTLFYGLVGKYFLTRNNEVKQLCLSVFEKCRTGNIYLYTFQLQKEDDPLILYEILRILCAQHASEGGVVIHQVLKSLSDDRDISFNVKLSFLVSACQNGFKLGDDLHTYLSERNNFVDVITQAKLTKALAYHSNTNFEEIIMFCNENINNAKVNGTDISTAFIIDSISIMCEKGVLDVSVIWDSLLKIVAGEQHPAVHQSVCNFLSKVPLLLKHRPDDNRVLYKSARVLWHFANDPLMNKKLALRSLRNFDLDVFDATFLAEGCKAHIGQSLDDSVITPISGNCWVHIIKDESYAELIIHFINKLKSKARFRGAYASLFEGLINYLSACRLDEEDRIKICLKILTAHWVNIPEGRDVKCFERFLSNSTPTLSFRELALYAILHLVPSNQCAKIMFENFLTENSFTEKEKAIMCLLPGHLLLKHRDTNEDLLFDGLLFALSTETMDLISGEPLHSIMEKVISSYANNYNTAVTNRRIIMKVLVNLWIKMPLNSEVFNRVTKLLAAIYGYPFLKSISSQLEGEMCQKYIALSREIAIQCKLMRCFDINVGLRHESLQDEVVDNLLCVLKEVGNENKSKNLKWILRVVCMCAMSTNDFLCKVVIYSMNYLSGVHMFILTDSLKENLDCFPLSASVISKISGKGRNVTLTMNEISKKTLRIHPAFVEVFKLGVLRVRDEPSILYETATKKCLD